MKVPHEIFYIWNMVYPHIHLWHRSPQFGIFSRQIYQKNALKSKIREKYISINLNTLIIIIIINTKENSLLVHIISMPFSATHMHTWLVKVGNFNSITRLFSVIEYCGNKFQYNIIYSVMLNNIHMMAI